MQLKRSTVMTKYCTLYYKVMSCFIVFIGCPLKHDDEQPLRQLLEKRKISAEAMEEVTYYHYY